MDFVSPGEVHSLFWPSGRVIEHRLSCVHRFHIWYLEKGEYLPTGIFTCSIWLMKSLKRHSWNWTSQTRSHLILDIFYSVNFASALTILTNYSSGLMFILFPYRHCVHIGEGNIFYKQRWVAIFNIVFPLNITRVCGIKKPHFYDTLYVCPICVCVYII